MRVRALTRANKEFIILSFVILLAFLGQHANDLRQLPLCDEFGFELVTLESSPFFA
jgi:hypothetical protein